jgi:multisubunit Na+/H+ antiporter MnhG subunit
VLATVAGGMVVAVTAPVAIPLLRRAAAGMLARKHRKLLDALGGRR